MTASVGRADAPPFVRLVERFGLNPFEQFCITATLALEIDRNKYGKAYALLQDDVTPEAAVPGAVAAAARRTRCNASAGRRRARSTRRRRCGGGICCASPRAKPASRRRRSAGESSSTIASRVPPGLERPGTAARGRCAVGGWDLRPCGRRRIRGSEDRLAALVADPPASGGAPSRLVVHVHGRSGTGRRSLIAEVCKRRALRLIRVDAGRLVALPTAAFDETLLLLAREPLLEPAAICLENVDPLLGADPAPAARLLTMAIETMRGTRGGALRHGPASLASRGSRPRRRAAQRRLSNCQTPLKPVVSGSRAWRRTTLDPRLAASNRSRASWRPVRAVARPNPRRGGRRAAARAWRSAVHGVDAGGSVPGMPRSVQPSARDRSRAT